MATGDDAGEPFLFTAGHTQRQATNSGASPGPTSNRDIDGAVEVQSPQPSSDLHVATPRVSPGSEASSIFGSSTPAGHSGSSASSVSRLPFRGREQTPVTRNPPNSMNSNYSSHHLSNGHEDVDTVRATASARMLPRVEKDVDDPTTPPPLMRHGRTRQNSILGTSLSRLLGAQTSPSPELSRPPSYIHPARPVSSYARSVPTAGMASLPNHVYERGFLDGRHSDITVHAFGQEYKLHRLILDRAPFFRSALNEPWLEASARETKLFPEDIDPSITRASFELALKRLYGFSDAREEDRESIGLFATACWLEMLDLVDTSVESILRQMNQENLAKLFKLVVSNYYGRAGDKVMASAKSMLCRDGWHMPIRYWDGIPADVIRETVGGDGFFVDGEWERWILAKKLLDRRLKSIAREAGLVESGSSAKVLKAPDAYSLMAIRLGIRLDELYYRKAGGAEKRVSSGLHQWASVYIHPDVEPLLTLLDEGVHYVHLDFEQLQIIRTCKDVLGMPAVPEKVISNALWQQMELRQKILNVPESELELGVSVPCAYDGRRADYDSTTDTTMSMLSSDTSSPKDISPDEQALGRASPDGDSCATRRRFWIPASDCNIVIGGNAEPVIAASNQTSLQHHPEDIKSPSDSVDTTLPTSLGRQRVDTQAATFDDGGSVKARYTQYPPFRFSVEFPNPRLMKKRQRVYSRTVFYAGSLWNVYIQKLASSRSKQLGVYLHRVKEEETEDVIAGSLGLAQGSVEERIARLEREMVMGFDRERRGTLEGARILEERYQALLRAQHAAIISRLNTPATSGSTSSRVESTRTNPSTASRSSRFTTSSSTATSRNGLHTPVGTDSDSDDTTDPDQQQQQQAQISAKKDGGSIGNDDPETRASHVPTLPPYVDVRPTIKTYSKIYSPSRGGRMLSVYESAPDKFNFSQSWGWKSSTLMLDEEFLSDTSSSSGYGVGNDGSHVDEGGDGFGVGGVPGENGIDGSPVVVGRRSAAEGDGKLRFMVVIGNV